MNITTGVESWLIYWGESKLKHGEVVEICFENSPRWLHQTAAICPGNSHGIPGISPIRRLGFKHPSTSPSEGITKGGDLLGILSPSWMGLDYGVVSFSYRRMYQHNEQYHHHHHHHHNADVIFNLFGDDDLTWSNYVVESTQSQYLLFPFLSQQLVKHHTRRAILVDEIIPSLSPIFRHQKCSVLSIS